MSSEDWEQSREVQRKRKNARMKWNTEVCQYLSGELGFDLQIIEPWHLRLIIPDGPYDFFPQSGKMTKLRSGRYFKVPDIEKFILDKYKSATK